MSDLSEIVARAPTDAGVYLMKGDSQKVIYVGKAKNIKNRVRSYFTKQAQESLKTSYLVSQIKDIEFITVGSEIEALILENNLIKKFKPKYNIRLRDDKSYPFIRVDLRHDFPRPYIARRPKKDNSQLILGPFTQGLMVHRALMMSSKVFKLRDCRDHEFSNRARPCLSYQIGQCTAPCVDYVSKEEYALQVKEFVSFLEGKNDELEVKWTKSMEAASDNLEFEKAASIRDQLHTLLSLTQQNQRMESVEDDVDRDVWAFWPESILNEVEEVQNIDLIVLQFREGKLIGREHFPIDIQDKFVDSGFTSSLLLQYYAKKLAPTEIVLPPFDVEWEVGALESELSSEGNSVHLVSADRASKWAKVFELARENAQLVAKEQGLRRQKQRDSVKSLAKFLKLSKEPKVIHCIDVSNFQGQANVASCVVFVEGKADKEQYRHYKIKTVVGQNDFASMKEVIERRYVSKEDPQFPDLLVLDGGKGQLNSVLEVFEEYKLSFPVIALAKARTESEFTQEEVRSSSERVFLPGQKNPKIVKKPELLKLLSSIRDEAHRFAITFHRKKRSEQMFE